MIPVCTKVERLRTISAAMRRSKLKLPVIVLHCICHFVSSPVAK